MLSQILINIVLGVVSLAFLVVALILVLNRARAGARTLGAVGIVILAGASIASILYSLFLPLLHQQIQLPPGATTGVAQLLLALLFCAGVAFLALAVVSATARPAPGVTTWNR